MILEHAKIKSNLNNKIFHPIYLLFGDEPYYTDEIVASIEKKVLTESEKAFNQTIVYGKDVKAAQLLETARRLPMMANHQLVIVKEAQDLTDIAELETYVKNPVKTTILVLAHKHKKMDKRKKFYKDLLKSDQVIAHESKAIREWEINAWLEKYTKSRGLQVDSVGISLLAEFLGTDLSKIVHEVDKLVLVKDKDPKVTVADIEKNIGMSKEYSIFELCNVLCSRDATKVNKIINYFSQNPKAIFLPMVLGNMFNYFTKTQITKLAPNLNDYEIASAIKSSPNFVKDYRRFARNFNMHQLDSIFEMLNEYDLKSKGVGSTGATNEIELLKEICARILAL